MATKFIKDSKNAKIAGKYKVCATYAPIKQTCPNTCALRNEGCYAQSSFVGMHNRVMEEVFKGHSALVVARDEARAIDAAFPKGVPQDGARGGRDLRLHVSGDCRTRRSATVVAAAARRYVGRGGGQVWAYTHAWRNVPRSAWKGVSILASVDTPKDILKAREQGYASAIVVPEHRSDRVYRVGNFKVVPCPAQTRDMACVDCRLCFNEGRLLARKQTVAFAAHGSKTNNIKRKLTVVS